MAKREGGPGRDVLLGTNANDVMEGKGGNDVLIGLAGNDIMDGDAGKDVLHGGRGNDKMEGGAGIDLLLGGAGNDVLSGDSGNDLMNGGAGNDRFVFDSGDGADRIVGFTAGGTLDLLDLRQAAFDFVNFNDVLTHATDSAGGVVIDLGAGGSVRLVGVTEAQLTAGDFLL